MFRIGDMVYPISNEYVERVVRTQHDRDEFLEAAFRAQEDMEWDFDPDDDNEGNW